jgi:hypothetical protein
VAKPRSKTCTTRRPKVSMQCTNSPASSLRLRSACGPRLLLKPHRCQAWHASLGLRSHQDHPQPVETWHPRWDDAADGNSRA